MTKQKLEKLARLYSTPTLADDALSAQYHKRNDLQFYSYGEDGRGIGLAFTPHHPSVRFLPLRSQGRRIELGTIAQYRLWQFLSRRLEELWPRQSMKTSLAELSEHAGVSRSAVSRFLRKLDLMRYADIVAIPGRGGAVYIWNSPKPSEDEPEFQNVAPQIRQRIRFKMLRHRVWQARFDRWRERYEEWREIAKHTLQSRGPVSHATFAR